MSTKSILAEKCNAAEAVETNVFGTVHTKSFFFIFKAKHEAVSALLALLNVVENLLFMVLHISFQIFQLNFHA